MELNGLQSRKYQEDIFKTAIDKNTLVVLPTGIGKTAIALLLSKYRLEEYQNSKILILSPTKPLCAQHVKSFNKFTDINKEEIILYTGAILAKDRKEFWEKGKIIIATPQTIKSDLSKNRISLKNVSLVVVDEAHRSRMNYANTYVIEEYYKQGENKRVLALTASPGSTKEKIEEICENLNIKVVEIRTLEDEDIKPYVQEKEIEWVHVDLPKEFEDIKKLINDVKEEKVNEIRRIIPNKKTFSKKDILDLQASFRRSISKGNKISFWGLSLTAQLLKLSYALELIETQGVPQLNQYWEKLKKDTSKAASNLINDIRIRKAMQSSLKFNENKHPKMIKLKDIIQVELEGDKEAKIIIFANYRNTIEEIYKEINKGLIKPVILVGQKEGLTQKEQVKRIKEFGEGIYNVLLCTSIGEEGLDIASANLAIFYEPVASEIRTIQRGGRVGRLIKGKIIVLITKKTRDESYYWSSRSKENTMKKTLYIMKENEKKLFDFGE